ncbi:hypothetical protein [Limnoglobus roseus]|uniref:Uncharacterized protein n=1 Tax=Limnoglobus roseus TaxID=2598579 RepID=A0A5C1ADQ4_9BACT|nr:hypothetical protein [Limnoglobus roseus]QEL16136.1 hypothetical protein PX52LOC_03075 [Limnoglobus roseus]
MTIYRLSSILLIFTVVGCGGPNSPSGSNDQRAFITADSWHSPSPDRIDFVPLGKDRFAPVIDTLQQESQAALSDTAVKQISADEAARLVGRPMPTGPVYVLLRGVVLFEGTGGFSIRVNGSAVDVHYGCLGRQPAPMTRKALVAALPSVPDKVFVSCSMAE